LSLVNSKLCQVTHFTRQYHPYYSSLVLCVCVSVNAELVLSDHQNISMNVAVDISLVWFILMCSHFSTCQLPSVQKDRYTRTYNKLP